MKVSFLFLIVMACVSHSAWAGPFYIRADGPEVETPPIGFLLYLKDGSNPNRNFNSGGASNNVNLCNFGLLNGRYYPYSTPKGRRIGFGLPVPTATKASDFANGITIAEADARLTAAVNSAAAALAADLGTAVWEGLDINCQEMLVDFALSEGLSESGTFDLTKIPATFKNTLLAYPTLAACRPQLAGNVSYERKSAELLNILKNRQFAFRFMGTYHH